MFALSSNNNPAENIVHHKHLSYVLLVQTNPKQIRNIHINTIMDVYYLKLIKDLCHYF